MFKISFSRDWLNDDPKKRKRIKGLHIEYGYYCLSCSSCDCMSKCKYKGGFKFHNWSVKVHRFFEYKLHIKLPHLLYISKHSVDLSGTTKCPFNKSRRYTCWDCQYCDGDPDGVCLNKERNETPVKERDFDDPDWGKYHRCKFFKKTPWADNWDKNTGERIF